MRVSSDFDFNISYIENAFSDCGDFVSHRFDISGLGGGCVMYIDNMINRRFIELHVIAELISRQSALGDTINPCRAVKKSVSAAEASEETDLDKLTSAILTGDAVLIVGGADTALIFSAKGFQSRGVPEVSAEASVFGSKEAFSEVMRTNTVLVRRRIRDTRLKVRQTSVGKRSRTDLAVMYMEDVARPDVVSEVMDRIDAVDIDALADSGVLSQLISANPRSPFPTIESTERPDKAAAAIMEGRAVIICDNSPFALIVPATLNTMYQASEDYYQGFHIMSLTRLLRFSAGFFAVTLPGAYIAAATYHPALLPSKLILKMAAARQDVPFPAVFEILLMELAFELLREAGTRMPKAVGGTFGIVGGIIVGQAAVEAGIVSPITVIIVALTAIAGFAIPHYSLVTGWRITKFLVIILSALFGFFGFCSALIIILTHLASMDSFGVPYLFPFVSGDVNGYTDLKDSLIRAPMSLMKKRPLFASPRNKNRKGDTP